MALSRTQIVDAAYAILRQHGLPGLSMRRLAQGLGVQPGALYYHVASKQELLAAVAERTLSDSAQAISTSDPAQAASDIRQALLPVRDSADVISFVQAFRPDTLIPLQHLQRLFAKQFSAEQARWAAQTLVHYVLGFVAEEQNYAELVRAKVLTDQPSEAESRSAFQFGVDAILRGLDALTPSATHSSRPWQHGSVPPDHVQAGACGTLALMSDSIKLGSVALDCADARQLAAFYAEITGGAVTSADEDWATVRCPGGDIDFQTAPG
ncbi:MAG TPA: TetR family transcriptional regulator, partial [Streptosporangiaceae bacterium]|nr:TetR family transcriptional regulator [Streptosporangiaceae bacterium]